MKLKQQPDDFRVEELADAAGGESGPFALHRLDKIGWTTSDALDAVRRRWQLDRRRVSYGGLKDRHAATSQFVTVFRGPKWNLSHERITLTYLGLRDSPFTSADIRVNRFTVVLRSLSDIAASLAEVALAEADDAWLRRYMG